MDFSYLDCDVAYVWFGGRDGAVFFAGGAEDGILRFRCR